ncbi:MAG: HAD family phosphatase [Christensenellaceae bacterium]|jgi:putative hydrolase of the HAD superfamily|nr:HAD family phosphatase [Christensenellaceae bacterium]
MLKAIIFDMYGVILKDPDGGLMPYINGFFPSLGIRDIYEPWHQMGKFEITTAEFWRRVGFIDDPAKSELDYLNTIEMEEGFAEAAERLKSSYRLALLSNDVSQWSRFVREKYALDQHFDAVLISADVGLNKPDVRIYKMMLERLNLKGEECLFVDDRPKNLLGAREAGMLAVMFERGLGQFDGKHVSSFAELADWVELGMPL